ncbi:hypothetical protein V6N13_083060 [Hibiscus sabdariffa]
MALRRQALAWRGEYIFRFGASYYGSCVVVGFWMRTSWSGKGYLKRDAAMGRKCGMYGSTFASPPWNIAARMDEERQRWASMRPMDPDNENGKRSGKPEGELVAIDKGFSFELDELLRASTYVLGKSRLGIVHKVVLGNEILVVVR